jgi:uncharacterized protein (TIRG00374 family)
MTEPETETQRIEPLDPRKIRTGLTVTLTIGVTVGLLVTFATGGKAVLAGILQLPLGYLLLALALSGLSWLGQGFGFAALTHYGIRGHLMRMTAAFLGGDFAALVTPFGTGGIPAGVFCLTREGLSAGESSAIIAMHSLLTGLFFLIMGALAAIVMPIQTKGAELIVWSGVAAIAVVLVFVVWLTARPRSAIAWLERVLSRPWLSRLLGAKRAQRLAATINHEARHFASDVEILTREKPTRLVLSFGGLFFSRICLVVCLPVIMYGLGWRGDLWPMLATAVGAMALAIISPTPGGSGAVEAATAALLATQAPAAMAGAATLLWRGVTYYAEVLAGWLAFTRYLAMNPRTFESSQRRRPRRHSDD